MVSATPERAGCPASVAVAVESYGYEGELRDIWIGVESYGVGLGGV